MPSEEEIKRIIELHEAHKSQREIAKEFSKSVGWVNGVLKALNVQTERSATKKATDAKLTYCRERRLALNDMFYDKICEMLKTVKSSRDLKDLSISLGIIEDKRHLLEPLQPDKEDDLLTKIVGTFEAHAISTKAGGGLPGLPQDPANPDVWVGEEWQN